MTASQTQIQNCAVRLSKIPLQGNMQEDINNILGYVDTLQEVDTDGVEPTYSVIDTPAYLHEDIRSNATAATPDELLDCSPQKVAWHQIVIPNIMQ